MAGILGLLYAICAIQYYLYLLSESEANAYFYDRIS